MTPARAPTADEATARYFTPAYVERTTLRGGMRVEVRLLRPTDRDLTIELAIPGVTPTELPDEPGPHGSMYKLFRAAAENAVEWTESVRKLWRR